MVIVVLFSISGLVMAYNFKQDLSKSQDYYQKLTMLKGMCDEGHPTTPQVNKVFCKCLSKGKTEITCAPHLSKGVKTLP
jgi:hypothetical protein